MWLVFKATGHGAKLYDNTTMENLMKSTERHESIQCFRESQFDMFKSGLKAEGEVISVNMVFLKAGTQTPAFVQKDPLLDKYGKPILTVPSNWWVLFEKAVQNAGGKIENPQIILGSTDASFFRQRGLPAIGFSAPDRVHDHDEFLNQEEYLKGVDT